jgi:tetratricopeptide (TPR) repeat protein
MRWFWAIVLMGLIGCAPMAHERANDYREDALRLYSAGHYDQAAESFEAALNTSPGDPDLEYHAARCYDLCGQTTKAEQFYNACLLRAPNHAQARRGLASLLVRSGRQVEATKMTEDWLANAPDRAEAYSLDGWLWHQSGDLPKAEGRLLQALELDRNDAWALVELGLVNEALRRPERALVMYERALEVNPHQPEVTQRLMRLQSQGVQRPKPE